MIFYFSCTGNTKWAAKTLAEATGDTLVNMADEEPGKPYCTAEGERIGFCFPIHGWRPPLTVRRFITRLNITTPSGKAPYCYAVCTAGDTVGEGMDIFESDLAQANLALSCRLSLLMPESFVGLPFMDVDKPQREKQKKDEAKRLLAQFTKENIMPCAPGNHIVEGRWKRTNSRLLGYFFIKHIIGDRHFSADPTKCTGCGRCAKVCPVDNIACPPGATPTWLHTGQCLSCFACYHHCPNRAIEYGRRTKGKGQYYYEKNKNNK